MSRFKFTVFDKETAKDIKQLLKTNKRKFMEKEKTDEVLDLDKTNNEQKNIDPVEVPKPKKRGRAKLTKEQKLERKKNRTPEQQAKINERMAKLRELRKKKKTVV